MPSAPLACVPFEASDDLAFCADVGATKVLAALARRDAAGRIQIVWQRREPVAAFASAGAWLQACALAWAQAWSPERAQDRAQAAAPAGRAAGLPRPPIVAACLGVAGPVQGAPGDERVAMTNHGWVIDAAAVALALGVAPRRVRLVNDFVAAAQGIDLLEPADLCPLQPAPARPQAPQLVLGAGTGLGSAWRLWNAAQARHEVWPGESGHAGFAPPAAAFDALLPALRATVPGGRVVAEHVVSGPGLVRLHGLVAAHTPPGPGLPALRAEDIVQRACHGQDAAAQKALELFLQAYGALAGDLALGLLARGGVFLCGGLAAAEPALLADGRFITAFNDKPPYAALMREMPVHAVTRAELPLLGAARLAFDAAAPQPG